MNDSIDRLRIEAALMRIAQERGALASACPSEVARALAPEAWRGLMPRVREAAGLLAAHGRLEITQGGTVVSPAGPWTGPIRIRLPREK